MLTAVSVDMCSPGARARTGAVPAPLTRDRTANEDDEETIGTKADALSSVAAAATQAPITFIAFFLFKV